MILYDSNGKLVIELHNLVSQEGSVNVSDDIHRIRFYATNNGASRTMEINVSKDGLRQSFTCKNCVGTATELDRIYLYGGLARPPMSYISGCNNDCEFYPSGEMIK